MKQRCHHLFCVSIVSLASNIPFSTCFPLPSAWQQLECLQAQGLVWIGSELARQEQLGNPIPQHLHLQDSFRILSRLLPPPCIFFLLVDVKLLSMFSLFLSSPGQGFLFMFLLINLLIFFPICLQKSLVMQSPYLACGWPGFTVCIICSWASWFTLRYSGNAAHSFYLKILCITPPPITNLVCKSAGDLCRVKTQHPSSPLFLLGSHFHLSVTEAAILRIYCVK